MTRHIRTEIAVIGAGVVGMTTALQLAREGREVLLIDPDDPGMGASYGNAGTIADYAVLPVGTPAVLQGLPALLFDRNSPLAIRHAALPTLAPWLMRFARQCLPAAARRNAQALAALLVNATPGWQALAAGIGGADLLHRSGCLYLYQTPRAMAAAKADIAWRKRLGVEVDLIDPGAVAALEPGLPAVAGGGAFFPQAVHLADPGRMMGLLATAAVAAGAGILRGRAERLERRVDGVIVTGPEFHLHARRVVIAAGAHSKALARQAGDAVPLDTERGYHAEWDMVQPRLARPVCPTARGFYLCPMQGRLRVAGTVELGGLTAPPSKHRIKRLVAGARAYFPDLGEPDRTWMGFRPSLPDSLPVIGPSCCGAEVIHAYGHGHIGLTLAPITARLVADLIAGRAPEIDLSAYRAGRF